nr:immunoglobulin heavy chain junction region [Macaca mulatta]
CARDTAGSFEYW